MILICECKPFRRADGTTILQKDWCECIPFRWANGTMILQEDWLDLTVRWIISFLYSRVSNVIPSGGLSNLQ